MGGEIASSNLVLNSGKITQTVTKESDVGAAVTILGKTKDEQPEKSANFIMYGGKISCNNKTEVEDKYGCVGAVGKGALANIEFGVLTSTDFCIYGQEPTDTWKLDNAKVNIYGGTLNSTNNTCLFLPSTSEINIKGGKISGLSCITANSGNVNISNSTKLTATATGTQSSYYDGSVIYVPKDKFDTGDLNINVEESTLTSSNEYIANIKDAKNDYKTTLDFKSGTYKYKKGTGLLIANENEVTVKEKGGTWSN